MSKYVQVALNVPLNQTFTYSNIEPLNTSRTGCRVEIKFGARKTIGCVISESDELPADCPVDESKIRPVTRYMDEMPLLSPELIKLAEWISSYYLCSIGEAVSIMLPSAKRETDAGGFSFIDDISSKKAVELSDEQKKAVNEILSEESKTNLHYLYGPTGTGKTEVFLQCAQRLLDQGKGVIYLVPEIGLTQQVIEAVVQRFGQTAAVLHSGLTPSQKLSEYKRIIKKEARVVIGARSAVFAPVPDLGMIIIDEEHDGSYKSGSTPRYHGRQVAMYRCSRLNIPLLMGSATPGVEAWQMMKTGVIMRHTLSKRLSGGAMPHIKSINLTNEPQDSGCISRELEHEINLTLAEKKQAILFLNRRGFSHFYRCRSCGFELKCKNCSVSLTYHKSENRLRCHYCGWNVIPPQQCPQCGSLDAGYSGFGTEFIEAEVSNVANRIAGRSLRLLFVWMLTASLFYIFAPELLIRLFSSHNASSTGMNFEQVTANVISILHWAVIFNLLDGTRFITMGSLRGAGDTRIPLLIGMATSWLIQIPGTILLVYVIHATVSEVWMLITFYIFIDAALMLWRRGTGAWRRIKVIELPAAGGDGDEKSEAAVC